MSSSGPERRLAGQTLPAGAHQVVWDRPEWQVRVPPPPPPTAGDHSERTRAVTVVVLTLACTALSIFDLFLLALGVS